MNPFRKPKTIDEETIEAMAAAWLAERDESLTPEEAQDFARWHAADPRHAAAVKRLERTWGRLQELRDFRPAARAHPDRDLLAPAGPDRPGGRPFVGAWVSLAAAATCLALVAVWSWRSGSVSGAAVRSPFLHFATTAGGFQRSTLPDGSIIELNASSEADVAYTPAERRVRLLQGEAHFEVAKNRARPFLVQAGSVTVRAVGTAFNVRFDPDQVEVLVTEGKVQVGRVGGPERAPDGPNLAAPGALSLVAAGQRVVIPTVADVATPCTARVEALTPEAIREALAWQGPSLVFIDTPLAQAIAQFNSRNAVQLVLGDPALASLPVGGSFRAENVDAFVRLLKMNGTVKAERLPGGRIVLLPAAEPAAP